MVRMTRYKTALLLIALLSVIGISDLRAEEIKHTFQFSTPMVESNGSKYQQLVLFTPEARESFIVHALLVSLDGDKVMGKTPLSGSCERTTAAAECHLSGAFAKFQVVIRLTKQPYGEIQSLGGSFGNDYNLLGLVSSEVVP